MSKIHSFFETTIQKIALIAPFALVAGIATYFALPHEPVIAWPWLICALLFVVWIRAFIIRERIGATYYVISNVVLIAMFGFFYSVAWTRGVDTQTMNRAWRDITIAGDVSRIDYSADRAKVWLNDAITDKNTPPMTMRITLSREDKTPNIGDTIQVRGAIFKPGIPDAPGAFDFSKWSYFNKIGASGYATENHIVISSNGAGGIRGFFQKLRDDIHSNIAQNASPRATMLADSLVLGHSRAMTLEESERIRASGLAHVFSISGFHMTLIGGWLFIIFNLIFKMFVPLTRKIPAAKLAVVATWFCLLLYLGISGAGIATLRAFAMASFGFLALIVGRNVFSMRILCLCMFGALLIRPHFALEAGFQMSFAAVFGLIYFFGGRKEYKPRNTKNKILRAIWLIIATSLISTIFTMPFLAHHFHAIALYGEIGNLTCLTIFSILILPLTLFGTIASTFGYFGMLEWAAASFEFTYQIITYISELPNALIYTPSIPGFALAAIAGGAMILILANGRAKHFGWIPIVLSVVYIFTKPAPLLYASADREVIALMTDSGNLRFNMPRSSDNPFVFESWTGLNAEPYPERDMRRAFGKGFDGENYSLDCVQTSQACIYKTKNWSAGIATRFMGLANHLDYLCENSDFIISFDRIDYPKCQAKIINYFKPMVIYPNGEIKFVETNRRWHKFNNPQQ